MHLTLTEPDDEAPLPRPPAAARAFVLMSCIASDWLGLLSGVSRGAATPLRPGVRVVGPPGRVQMHRLVMHSPAGMGYLPKVAPEPHDSPSHMFLNLSNVTCQSYTCSQRLYTFSQNGHPIPLRTPCHSP